jgi:general secretion pathway protein G
MIRTRAKGFTLIELLAVIAIIGILATFAAISISGAVKRARDSLRERDLTNVKQALELYNQDNGSYPGGSGNVVDALAVLKTDGYIKNLPSDPKKNTLNRDYAYTTEGGNDYILYTELEYNKTNGTLTNSELQTCDDAKTKVAVKGNGVVQERTRACFRLTND